MRSVPRATALLVLVLALPSCALHSIAKEWHGRVGPDGAPVYLMATTHIGFNLLIFIPVIGGTSVPRMIEEVTAEVAAEGGDQVRVVETGTENYWYGWPPFTWVITPVVSGTTAEYRPSTAQFAQDRAVWQGEEPEKD